MSTDRDLRNTWTIDDVAQRFASAPAEELIAWAIEQWGPRMAVCTSFQAEGMVILDMARRIDPKVRVFTVDTGRLPQETYDLMERVRERYQVEVEVFFLTQQVEAMVREPMAPIYSTSRLRRDCGAATSAKSSPCGVPFDGLEAWITGLRRDQSTSRAMINRIELDAEHAT
jgi:3'-phosphoadenosine 5'-phosphosulfate sulfotransferase (PAPS reductase)/FAD synthetase